jgi:hypothetical protein
LLPFCAHSDALVLLTGAHSTGKSADTEELKKQEAHCRQGLRRTFPEPHACSSATTAQLSSMKTNVANNTEANTNKNGYFMAASYRTRDLHDADMSDYGNCRRDLRAMLTIQVKI